MRHLLPLLFVLAGCDRDAPPAPTGEETRQLDEAEAMLNDLADEEKGPEANAPDPSTRSN